MINEINKANSNKSFRVLLLALAFVAVGLVINPSSASAATPPDNCFNFNSGTNTIEDYYDNEDNNGANPACPRDVDIPATIGGDAVTVIDNNAFSSKNLTAVTIPNSVTSAGNSSFANNDLTSVVVPSSLTVISSNLFFKNKLTSVVIPNSITVIDNDSFAVNNLTELNIPNSVTTITDTAFAANKLESVILPDSVVSLNSSAFVAQNKRGVNGYTDLFSGNAVLAEAGLADVFYARIYTASSSNPNGLADALFTEATFSYDYNQDGDLDDSLGGHIINPVAINLSYKDTAGNSLLPDLLQTGSGGLADYMAKNNPNNELERYYRLGSQQAFTPPAINGFVTPANASFALDTAPTTNYSFVYQPNAVATSDTSATLADTGDDANTLELLAAVLILAPLVTTILYQRNRKHHTA